MPWKIEDVEKHKAGLSDTQKEKWVRIANESLQACIENGGDDESCAPKAIRIANSQFSDNGEIIYAALKEIEDTGDFQLILPVGHFHHPWYGEFDVTDETCSDMVENWKAKVLGERQPYIDVDHDAGGAMGWIQELKADTKGLHAKIEWTPPGKELLQKGIYKYFSAEMGSHMDPDTGLEVKNVLIAATLTNRPFMSSMPEAHLSDNLAHSDKMNLSMVMEKLKMVTAERDRFKTALFNRIKEQVFSLAIQEGKMLPAQKESLSKLYDADPEAVRKMLIAAPKIIDFSSIGTGSGGTEIISLSAEDRKVMKAMKLTEEDYRKSEEYEKAQAARQ